MKPPLKTELDWLTSREAELYCNCGDCKDLRHQIRTRDFELWESGARDLFREFRRDGWIAQYRMEFGVS